MGLSLSIPFTLLFVFSFLVFSPLSLFLCSLPSLFLVMINMIHATVALRLCFTSGEWLDMTGQFRGFSNLHLTCFSQRWGADREGEWSCAEMG